MRNLAINLILLLYTVLIVGGYVFEIKPLIVTSDSMSPSIKKGDLIIVSKESQYFPGEIISYMNNQEIITHRIEAMDDGLIQTKGDANSLIDDGLVIQDQIVGEVKMIAPYFGFVFFFLQSKQFLYLLIVLAIFYLMKEIFNVKK